MNALALTPRHALTPVAFHEDTVYLVEHEGEPYVPLRPIVENLGLDWKVQHRKIMAAERRWSVVMMTTVAADGSRRKMAAIPLRKLFGFLASIEPSKVKSAIRPKLELYQVECDDALYRYWTGQHGNLAPYAALAPIAPEALEAIREDLRLTVAAKWRTLLAEYRLVKRVKPPVTRGERAVWSELILRGWGVAQIARQEGRHPSTVRKHTADARARLRRPREP